MSKDNEHGWELLAPYRSRCDCGPCVFHSNDSLCVAKVVLGHGVQAAISCQHMEGNHWPHPEIPWQCWGWDQYRSTDEALLPPFLMLWFPLASLSLTCSKGLRLQTDVEYMCSGLLLHPLHCSLLTHCCCLKLMI